jgi:peptidoglycan/xylan/chitin deacetylase (PgdA/CDA1 family)
VTIGSHSHTHALFDRIDPTTARDEIERSVGAIGDHLGLPVAHFAYPKALRATGHIETEVRRAFTSAALARSRVNRPGRTDPHRLWRTPVQRTDGPSEFTAKALGGMRLEGELRDLVARRRYRRADH